jgi:PHD/YefM family antitoxin component YafN of YafNO toxin-antitoxin module
MLVETDNLVSAEEFRKRLNKYLTASQQGCGPIAVTRKSEVVGFFVGAKEYEALFGTAVRELLEARAEGQTVSHEETCEHIDSILRASGRKS